MHRLPLFLISLFCITSLFSQDVENYDYQLEITPSYSDSIKAGEDNSVVLKYKYSYEYIFKDGELALYVLLHKKIRVFTDEGVEANNKVYIPLGGRDRLMSYEARVVTPEGKVTALGTDAIKEGTDDESGYTYKYFAFEGIEKGVDLEYYYLIKRENLSYTGRAFYLQQDDADRHDVDFSVISPSNLLFKFKSYNGLPEMVQDSLQTEKNVFNLHIDYLPKFHEQKNAFDRANMQYLMFKLDKNIASNKSGVVSYGNVSQAIYDGTHLIEDNKEKKMISKFVKKMEIDRTSTETMIRSVENAIKTKFSHVENSNPALANIAFMMEHSAYNSEGAAKLFCTVLDELDIKHVTVITCDRTELPFDKDFEAYSFLDEYILYFPSLDMYLEPANFQYRLGYVSPGYMNTYGLFIKAVKVGDFVTGTGKVKWIEPLTSDKTYSHIYAKVNFNKDFEEPVYEYRTESFGFYAYYQSFYDVVKEQEKKDEFTRSALENIDEEGEIKDLKVENEGGNNFGLKPYVVTGNIVTDKFLEVGGKKYLFKVGEMIGPQMEMYQEEERVLPVQNSYNRSYHREITFNIPEGYKIVNLDDLNMKVQHETDGKVDMSFVSTYKQTGNSITVTVDESYDRIELPKEEYEAFQKVINAAADFNKIVLIYEPI
ncbi:DUF3857 domain-containing protein [Cyclobacteriaceae bacterium]|nr:DUF3857 domain-containing protein [Cyclobacteriaceae bacterium]